MDGPDIFSRCKDAILYFSDVPDDKHDKNPSLDFENDQLRTDASKNARNWDFRDFRDFGGLEMMLEIKHK